MPIRALIFDLWGTLIEDSVVREEPRSRTRIRLATEALAKAGHPYPQGKIVLALQAYNKEHGALHAQGRDIAFWGLELFLELVDPRLAERLSPDGRRAVEGALTGAIRQHPPLPAPGSHDVLREGRRRGLALGLVSNTGISPGYVLRDLLAEYELLSYLQVLTFSDEACLVKPAQEMFSCTLEVLNVHARDAVFIDDLPQTDVAGARAVGMWAVQIGDKEADGVQPHARIASLHELFPALRELGLLDEVRCRPSASLGSSRSSLDAGRPAATG